MRPRSILIFERLFLASLAIGLVQAWLGWDALVGRAAADGHGLGMVLTLLGLTFFTLAGLALLVSRGRQASAKWVLTLLCALGLPLVLASLRRGSIVGSHPLALVQAGLQVASLLPLFTGEARRWLASGRF
ncbi:hypothetical protein [Sphingosinicella sp. BN140058]|uniref:hypothetical protein n=1 Tax=Sphingosinicella sp. BN140058 TaxID=1892855 RepID=UPI00101329AB|nr:hypothetical protein [Sphingosinicella sp. BN140058]QAY75958.1 hypothetical protein ETR14_05020 [Sphingosinicella sp. BN140058]